VLRGPPAVRVLAEHDLRLVGVQLETQGPESFSDGSPKLLRLGLGVAVGDDVVRVALEGRARVWDGVL
jgi:hypothetical protein